MFQSTLRQNDDSEAGSPSSLNSKPQAETQEQFSKLWEANRQTEERIKVLLGQYNKMESLLIVGFLVLLVMVATIIIMVLLSWIDSNNQLILKVDSLQMQIATGTRT